MSGMSERPSAGIGKRLAKYRKLADLSARELSEKIGGELSRGVIANIESGRKTDVTIDQLVALAWALGVPPAALALPVDEPYKFVRTTDGAGSIYTARAFTMMEWFQNEKAIFTRGGATPDDTPAGALAQETIAAVRDYPRLQYSLQSATSLLEQGKVDAEVVRERELELQSHERYLRQLGVDLKVYKVDE
jgi:transcriptional regulator with XRE-family HTH domain